MKVVLTCGIMYSFSGSVAGCMSYFAFSPPSSICRLANQLTNRPIFIYTHIIHTIHARAQAHACIIYRFAKRLVDKSAFANCALIFPDFSLTLPCG